jgi:hypothetical protein
VGGGWWQTVEERGEIDTHRKSIVHPVETIPIGINVVNRNMRAQQPDEDVVRDGMVQFPDV